MDDVSNMFGCCSSANTSNDEDCKKKLDSVTMSELMSEDEPIIFAEQ